MKLTIFGSTGDTGKLLVKQALENEDQVTVYARNPTKLNIKHERLLIIEGELDDLANIERAIKDTDAVISLLGPRGGSKGKPLTRGIRNIITAMKRSGVRRLIVTSTLSAKDPNDLPEFRAKVLVTLVKLMMRAAYEDIIAVAESVRSSDLEWTIVRLTLLNNKPKTGEVRSGYLGKGEVGTWISRANIADFILRQVQDMTYLRQAPAISS
jgi:putative NADH-flavin reductase